jgi:hypothetical protein
MPKVEEFFHINNKKCSAQLAYTPRKRWHSASAILILGILDHFKF